MLKHAPDATLYYARYYHTVGTTYN